jgi:hypothetical protein
MVAQACHHRYVRKNKYEDCSPGQQGIKQDAILKTTNAKRAGGVSQVLEYLPSKWTLRSSTPVLHKL